VQPAAAPSFDATVELIRRYQHGDPSVLDELCARYWPRVLTLVRHRIGPGLRAYLDAEDIVQETFEAALPVLDRFEMREDAAFIQWLSKVAQRRIQSAARSLTAQKRERAKEVRLRSAASDLSSTFTRELADSDTSIPDRVARAELISLVEECIDELPDDFREVILLRDLAGGDWPFVTQELQRPSVAATQELYRRAKVRLAAMVGRRVRSPD
jgi:RNA polymerase sigma-70 factor (ECF subfamily)